MASTAARVYDADLHDAYLGSDQHEEDERLRTLAALEPADDEVITCTGPGCRTVIRAGWFLCPRCESIRDDAERDARAEVGADL